MKGIGKYKKNNLYGSDCFTELPLKFVGKEYFNQRWVEYLKMM